MATTPYKILIVDDDVDLLELFSTTLRRRSYQVFAASSSKQAFSILEEQPCDLIVVDLAMPEISGVEFMKQIRGDPRFSAVKIIVMTAVPVMLSKEDHDRANLVITKPITPSGLEEAIRKLLTS